MRGVAHFTVALALAAAIGCSSTEEKKPEGKKPFLELKITPPATRTITVDSEGGIADVLSPSKVTGKLRPDDLKTLQALAASIEWAKIPNEGFKTADGKPVEGGRTYDLTYSGMTPPKLVHSMDGAAEVTSFTRLRDTIEADANKIGK